MSGSAMLILTAMFLFFAMADLGNYRRNEDEEFIEALLELRGALSKAVLLLADTTVDSYKRLGRSMPCTPAELNKFEDDFKPLLNSLKINRKERERILQEVDKLRTRSRQDDGRRALTGVRF